MMGQAGRPISHYLLYQLYLLYFHPHSEYHHTDVAWLTGRLLSAPDEGPSRAGEDKKMQYILKYRSPGGHSEHAHPKITNSRELSNNSRTSTLRRKKRAQLEYI